MPAAKSVSRHGSEHQGFREQLHDNAPSAGAERGPYHDFGLASRCARKHEEPDVGAHQHEQHQDEDIARQQHRPFFGPPEHLHRLGKREKLRPEVLVGAREIVGGDPSEIRELDARLPECRTRRQPPDDLDRHSLPPIVSSDVDPERNPQLLRARKRESVRHHADDSGRHAGDANRAADDAGIALKAALPQVVSDHRDDRRVRTFVHLHERPSEQRWDAQYAERGRGHLGGEDGFGQTSGDHEIPRDRAVRAKVVHGLERLAPHHEVVRRAELRTVRRRVPVLHDDDPVALRKRNHGKHELANRFEGPCPHPDGERHGDAADDRQYRVLDQHPTAELHVEPGKAQRVEPGQAARAARFLDLVLRATELGARFPRRVGG